MTTNLPEFMQEQKRLAEAATPGPWDSYRPNAAYRIFEVCSTTAQSLNETLAEVSGYNADNDSEFVIAARTSVPKLIAALEAVVELPIEVQSDSPEMAQGWADAMRAVRQRLEAALIGGEGDGAQV